MQILPTACGFDPALEPSIISVVARVGDEQVIAAEFRSKVNAVVSLQRCVLHGNIVMVLFIRP